MDRLVSLTCLDTLRSVTGGTRVDDVEGGKGTRDTTKRSSHGAGTYF